MERRDGDHIGVLEELAITGHEVPNGHMPASETGPGAYLVTPANTPDKSTTSVSYGKLDRWTLGMFDYLAPYEKAWGVNLHSVIQNES